MFESTCYQYPHMKGEHILAAFIKKTIDVFAYFEEKSRRRVSDASGKSIN